MTDKPQSLNNTVVETRPITVDNLPKGNYWDEDGACFKAAVCDAHEQIIWKRSWRWRPMNMKALGKGEPDKELFDFYMPIGGIRVTTR